MPAETDFFALLRDEKEPVRRIKLTQEVQQSLTSLFAVAGQTLVDPTLEQIPFEGAYRPDEGEVLFIPDFKLPEQVTSALLEPTACEDLKLTNAVLPNIRAVFTGSPDGKSATFQAFKRTQFLSTKGISIILSGDTFRRLDTPGLNIGERVDALFDSERLYFRSYLDARRALDLAEYYREATDKDIATFAALPSVRFADATSLQKNADSWVRRRIAIIQDKGVLEKVAPASIHAAAIAYNVPLNLISDGGNEALLLPDDKKGLKAALKFLDEDYYTGPVSGQQYVSNSKRTL